MGSAGFKVEDESQASTSNGKKCRLPRKLPDNGGAVNHASVPRKLRSAIKKKVRKSVTPNLPISRKQHHVSNGFEILRKDGGKRSKSNKKQGNITKDEEEVAETLYALAGMFSDASKTEQPQAKASATLEAESSVNVVGEESRNIASRFTTKATCNSSSLVDSVSKIVNFQSLGEAQQPELPANKQPASSGASGNQSEKLDPRLSVSDLHVIPIGERAIAMEQDAPTQTQVGSKKLGKRCSGHIYISSLIKNLKVSEGKERLLEKPAQIVADAGLRSHATMHNQTMETSGRNGVRSSNGTAHFAVENDSVKTQNHSPSHKGPLQDHQLATEISASCSSSHQGFDFMSLSSGVTALNPSEAINRTRQETRAPNHFHAPYVQSHSNGAILFSPSQNGYSAAFRGQYSSLATQQVQLSPQYPGPTVNSIFSAQLQLDSQQQKWAAELPTQYNTRGVGALQLADWKNGGIEPRSMLNYAHTLFPHLQSALSSKYHQQFSHSQQEQLMALNSTPLLLPNVKRNHNQILPLGFERNGSTATAFYQESIPQHLQLPCNQHLSNC